MKDTINLKIIYGELIIRSKLPQDYKELRLRVSSELYDYLEFDNFNLYYIDNEGDKVSLTSQEDFCHARQYNEREHTFRLIVEKKNPDILDNYEIIEPKSHSLPSEIKKSEILSINDSEIKLKKNLFAKLITKKSKKIEKSMSKLENKIRDDVHSISKNSNLQQIEEVTTLIKKNISDFVNKKFEKLKNKIIKKAFKFTDREVKRAINSEKSIHKITCNGCRKTTIKGILYKCAVCEIFNFCSECEENNLDHEHHPFLKIRNPQQVEVRSLSIYNKQFGQINYENGNLYNEQLENNFLEISNPIYNSKCPTQEIIINHKMKNLKKRIKILNSGSSAWPEFCQFINIKEESSILGKNTKIRHIVDSLKEIEIEINLNTENIKEGDYKSVWQLYTDKRLPIGEKIILDVKVNYSNDILIKSDFIQIGREIFINKEIKVKSLSDLLKEKKDKENLKPQSKFMKLVQEIKSSYGVTDVEDKLILNAILFSEMNLQVAYERIKTMRNTLNYRSKY
jgi:hypothetical protein